MDQCNVRVETRVQTRVPGVNTPGVHILLQPAQLHSITCQQLNTGTPWCSAALADRQPALLMRREPRVMRATCKSHNRDCQAANKALQQHGSRTRHREAHMWGHGWREGLRSPEGYVHVVKPPDKTRSTQPTTHWEGTTPVGSMLGTLGMAGLTTKNRMCCRGRLRGRHFHVHATAR